MGKAPFFIGIIWKFIGKYLENPEEHRETIGKPEENGGLIGVNGDNYPLVSSATWLAGKSPVSEWRFLARNITE